LRGRFVKHFSHRLDARGRVDGFPDGVDWAVFVFGVEEETAVEGGEFGEEVGFESVFEQFEAGGGDAAVDQWGRERVSEVKRRQRWAEGKTYA
jgi:hypothetical protein